jgi:ABC-type sugar transport system substrate-binding protein
MSKRSRGPGNGPHSEADPVSIGLSRREMLQRTALGAGALVGASLLPPWMSTVADAATTPRLTTGKGVPYTHFKQFKPFDTHVPKGPATGLPKAIASNFGAGSAYFIEFADNLKKAASDRGFSFTATTYGTDLAQNISELDELFIKGIGALVAQPLSVAGEAATMVQAIQKGICVAYEVTGPSTIQIVTDQYVAGYHQGVAAADWVKAHLGGKAQAVVFDASLISPSLLPRTQGRIAGLKTLPGIQIVAKQPIKLLTAAEGSTLSATLLEAHPGIDVWVGDDDTCIGVLATLESDGKTAKDPIYISGLNGQANALAAVKKGTLFRADFAFPNGVYEYATGQLCADYVEGKSVPQLMYVYLVQVTPANIDGYLADDSDPGAAYRRGLSGYMTYLGNISYANRLDNYVVNAVGP